jgi:signal transduction histidine kinase
LAARTEGLALDLQFSPALPDSLLGDELRLQQILNHLLCNAFKFTERGSVTISLASDVTHLLLHVVDTVPGSPALLYGVIFERFRQGKDKVSYQHGGTGLGLALSRALAELMGGMLTVSAQVGVGLRFTLSLPLKAVSPT